MSQFREWQQLPQTRSFVQDLKKDLEILRQDAVGQVGNLTIEQIAIRNIELRSEANVLTKIIEILTEEQDDESIGL